MQLNIEIHNLRQSFHTLYRIEKFFFPEQLKQCLLRSNTPHEDIVQAAIDHVSVFNLWTFTCIRAFVQSEAVRNFRTSQELNQKTRAQSPPSSNYIIQQLCHTEGPEKFIVSSEQEGESDSRNCSLISKASIDSIIKNGDQMIGKGTTESDEQIYFKIDLITEENKGRWEKYKMVSVSMSSSWGKESLYYFAQHTHRNKKENNSYFFSDPITQTSSNSSGFTDPDEFETFIHWLGHHGFTHDSKKSKQLYNNSLGSQYTQINVGSYIVYATKNAEFDIMQCPEFIDSQTGFSVKDFTHDYGDILMCVSSDPNYQYCDEDSFLQVGIFRNLISVIDGNYKNISMMLHAFTCVAMEIMQPLKKKMFVWKPTDVMLGIMQKELKDNIIVHEHGDVTIQAAALRGHYYKGDVSFIDNHDHIMRR